MELSSLSLMPHRPCFLMKCAKATILLDAAVNLETLSAFHPQTVITGKYKVHSQADADKGSAIRKSSLTNFIDAIPEVQPVSLKDVEIENVDAILISNTSSLFGLPFITERNEFHGIVLCTTPTKEFGGLMMHEFQDFISYVKASPLSDEIKNSRLWASHEACAGFDLKILTSVFTKEEINKCLDRITAITMGETKLINGIIKCTAYSSGYSIGSCNWLIEIESTKFGYVSTSSAKSTHMRICDWYPFKNVDYLSLNCMTSMPEPDPYKMCGFIKNTMAEALKKGGNVLFPINPVGYFFDLLEVVFGAIEEFQIPRDVPVYFISSCANSTFAFINVYTEWLKKERASKVNNPEEPFVFGDLVRDNRIKIYDTITGAFSKEFKSPCIVFTGHPSLHIGNVVNFLELWGQDKKSVVISTDPECNFREMYKPFRDLQIRAYDFPIETRLDSKFVNDVLLPDLTPKTLIVPKEQNISLSYANITMVSSEDKPQSFKVASRKRALIQDDLLKTLTMEPKKAKSISSCSVRGFLSTYDNDFEITTNAKPDLWTKLPALPLKKYVGVLTPEKLIKALSGAGVTAEYGAASAGECSIVKIPRLNAEVKIESGGLKSRICCNSVDNRRKIQRILMERNENEESSSAEWAVKSVIHDVGEQMDALCTNKTFDLFTVAGRAVMKVFSLKNNEFKQEMDLKSKTRRMNLYFSGSVSWNPIDPLVAATSSTGQIVLFNLERCQASAQDSNAIKFIDPEGSSNVDHFFRAHKAAATKVCFHPFNKNLFISGLRDSTIFLHDLEAQEKPVASFGVKGNFNDQIRDLQFCLDLQHQYYFVTGSDSGIVRFWDIRQPGRYLKEFIGNTRSVAFALHPNPDYWNQLATVGGDGFIRIWNWAADKPETLHTIETPTTAGRVEWDTKNHTNLATTTTNHDHQLLMWSYNRPYFPIMSFRGNKTTNISDMAFPQQPTDENKIITCDRAGALTLHFMDYGDVTLETTVPIAMSTGPYNEFLSTYPKEYLSGNTVAEFDYSKSVEPSLVQYSEVLPVFNDTDNLAKLAKSYKFAGESPVRICNWNAYVNKRLENYSLAYTWKVIGVILQQVNIVNPQQSCSVEDKYFEYITADKPKREQVEGGSDDDADLSSTDSESSFEAGAFCQKFQETLAQETDLFFNTKEFKMTGMPGGNRFLEFIQQKHDILMRTDFSNINEEAITTNPENVDDESETGSELDARSNISDHQELSSTEEKDSSSDRTSQSNSPTLLSSCGSTILEDSSDESISSDMGNWVDDQEIESYFASGQKIASDNWGPLSMLKKLINAYSDIGDSQTCATVCLILGKTANQMFGDDQVSAWFFHYIEMLQDAGFNELATFIAKQSTSEEVIKVIQENMHVKFFCANCSTASPSGMTSCPKCRIIFATVCTVCDHEVKGLFSQCNSCGHGGHYQHLEEWFKNFGICAFPGCMHVCIQKKQQTDQPNEDDSINKESTTEFKNRQLNPCGQYIFYDLDDQSYYRDETGSIRKLPEIIESADQKRRKPNKYSLDP
ncbi:Beta-Casp domain-containing protein [Aphelenchoides bicaudatus]|nr:Beta-Casp domain-containing protein [Aphelenchoides bicaudatus]